MSMKVAVIGCGLIGQRRAKVAKGHEGTSLAVVVDLDAQKASQLASELGCEASQVWQDVMHDRSIDIVVVSTPTSLLPEISLAAVKAGKHVLAEKPLGQSPDTVEAVVRLALEKGIVLKTGFSLRYHPAIREAQKVVASGVLGKLLYATCTYGHGGRLGYEKDWRCDPTKVSGGELLDQGIHVVDLFRWFLGGIEQVSAYAGTLFWPIAPLDDNGFGMLRMKGGAIASFHVSWSRWRNRFALEVFGELGYVQIQGLGGSYGVETLIVGKRAPQFGAPTEEKQEFPGGDISWDEEWKDFIGAIQNGHVPSGTGRDGLEALKTVWALYESARTGQSVKIENP